MACSRKGTKNAWTDVQLKAAKEAVQSGELSIRKAGEKFGIPKSTLQDHVKGTSTKRYGGPHTVLTPIEEKEIATICVVMQERGFPLTRDFVSVTVRDYLRDQGRANPFTNGIPGYDWWSRFLRRNPNLSERKLEHLQISEHKQLDLRLKKNTINKQKLIIDFLSQKR